jgi:hypothetical protein
MSLFPKQQPSSRVFIKIDGDVHPNICDYAFIRRPRDQPRDHDDILPTCANVIRDRIKYRVTRIKFYCDNVGFKIIFCDGSEELVYYSLNFEAKHLITYEYSNVNFNWDLERLLWIGHIKPSNTPGLDSQVGDFCWFLFLPKDIISKIIGEINSTYSITGEIKGMEYRKFIRDRYNNKYRKADGTWITPLFTKNIIFEINEKYRHVPGRVRMKLEHTDEIRTNYALFRAQTSEL